MFRKKRSASTSQAQLNQQLSGNASSSAASAAAQAFLKKQASDANLSSAAAAAALRSHTVSPEPVGNIQTKRMVRRGSTSSVGSPHGSLRQPFSSDVQRRGSNASMTERNFRSPSPAPRIPGPLPSIPDEIPPIPQKSNRRPSSVASNMDVANGAGAPNSSNVGRPVARPPPNLQRQPLATNSPRSVNFSRPMSPPPAPSARMVQETGRTRPASSLGFRQNDPAQRPLSIAATVRSNANAAKLQAQAARMNPKPRPVAIAGPASALTAATLAARPNSTAQSVPARSMSTRASANVRPASTTPQSRPQAMVAPARPASTTPQSGRNESAQTPATVPAMRPTFPPTAMPTKSAMRSGSAKTNVTSTNIAPTTTAATTTQPRPQVTSISTGDPEPTKRTANTASSQRGLDSPSNKTSIPSPTQEQIRVFQTRAAAHLARPLSGAIVPETTEPRRSASTVIQPSATGLDSKSHTRSVSQPMKTLQTSSTGSETSPSVSPSRATHAHFSNMPLLEAIRHQPNPRAASPAKSALKGSSRGTSPVPPMPAMSDTSDTHSIASEEGGVVSSKKKKSVRVSFDEQPELVGVAAGAQSPAAILSPQYAKGASPMSFEDAAMTPRPALPSFGSVRRGSRSPTNDSTAVGSALSGSSPVSKSTLSTWAPAAASTDETAGGILAHDFAETQEAKKRSESANGFAVPSISVLPATPKLGDEEKSFSTNVGNESFSEGSESLVQASMPEEIVDGNIAREVRDGAFNPSSVGQTTVNSTHAAVEEEGYESGDTAEAYEDAAEEPSEHDEGGGFASLDAIIESPTTEAAQQDFPPISASQPDMKPVLADTSVISKLPAPVAEAASGEDWETVRAYWNSLSVQRKQQIEQEAAEHLKDQRGAPLIPAATPGAFNFGTPEAKQDQASSTAGETRLPPWPDQQYQTAINAKEVATQQAISKPPVSKQIAPKQATSKQTAARPTSQPSHERIGSDPVHMKSSLRGATPTGGLRTSMRDSSDKSAAPTGGLRTSMRDSGERYQRPASAQSGRPRSDIVSPSTTAAATTATALALARTMAPPLRRQTSSGSESSFRRKKAGSDAGKYSMRRSMRGASESSQDTRPLSPTPSRGTRFSMRSPSPAQRNPAYGSARGSTESSAPSLRGPKQAPPKSSSSFLGFGGKQAKSKPPKSKSSGGFRSRFDDSSDDEDVSNGGKSSRIAGFRSRFDDSDDEGDVPIASTLRPVRGIPRKVGQASGDSTDLSDSDDDALIARSTALATLQNSNPPATPTKMNGNATQGTSLSAGTLRGDATLPASPSSPKTKRGLFGFGKRRSVMADKIPESPSGTAPVSPTIGVPTSRLDSSTTAVASQAPESPSASAPASMPKTMRSPTPTGDRSRKMLRRFSSSTSTPPVVTGANFPYPVPPIPNEHQITNTNGTERPSTSDGVAGGDRQSIAPSTRPTLGNKRHSTMTASGDRPIIVSGRTGKPKKFQGLRRLLGVHD